MSDSSTIRFTEGVKYEFSAKELAELSQQLAAENLKIAGWEQEKSLTSSHLGSLIKEARAKAYELSQKVQNKFELREVEVTVLYDEPSEGLKRIVDIATGETIREVEMSREERLQRRLDFERGS